jgi:hypothetical protein
VSCFFQHWQQIVSYAASTTSASLELTMVRSKSTGYAMMAAMDGLASNKSFSDRLWMKRYYWTKKLGRHGLRIVIDFDEVKWAEG